MCDGTPCPCNILPPADHADRHRGHGGRPPRRPAAIVASGLRAWWMTFRCPAHCWHRSWDVPATEPEWYCCECPGTRRREAVPPCPVCG